VNLERNADPVERPPLRRRRRHDDGDRNTITNPTLVVEVLSPSTAAYDRGEKLEHYEKIPSLREVVLVAHDERLIEAWLRGEDNTWSRREARSGSLSLSAVACTLSVEDVYRDELAAGDA
jgi:Uma2 family endonuclease